MLMSAHVSIKRPELGENWFHVIFTATGPQCENQQASIGTASDGNALVACECGYRNRMTITANAIQKTLIQAAANQISE